MAGQRIDIMDLRGLIQFKRKGLSNRKVAQAQGILALTKSYPPERVEAACKRGCGGHRAGYRTIANILSNGLDQIDQKELSFDNHIPDHPNIRGGSQYS